VLALALASRGLVRRTTWYLASDQFAFLTFADDLRAGHVFHDPTDVRLTLAPGRFHPGESADAYFQTYIYRDGLLWSRYPPGFPLLLALAGAVGGEIAAHVLNPALYLALLVLLAWLAREVVRAAAPAAAAGAGAAAVWLLLTLPAEVHYWGITVVRDLPAHVLALAALAAAWRGRLATAGLLLGLAASARPDVALYGLSLGALALYDRRPLRAVAAGAAAFVVGALPLFAYNVLTGGGPLSFTQGMEFRNVLGAAGGRPSAVLAAFTPPIMVQGGGFRLAHLRDTLPGHATYLARAFGGFLVPAAGALAWSTRRAPRMATLLVPYAATAFLFYSCWSHPDPRYLVGVALWLMVLAAAGTAIATGWLARCTPPPRVAGSALAVLLALLAPWTFARPPGAALTTLERATAAAAVGVAVAAAIPAAAAPATALAPLAPAAALAVVALVRVASATAPPDPMRAPDVARARATLRPLLPPHSLVLVDAGLGRPAENLTHYVGVHAIYPGELRPFRSRPTVAAQNYLRAGRRVFLLLRAGEASPLDPLPPGLAVHEVARRHGPALYDWFVDPRGAPRGAVLLEATTVATPGRALPSPRR
jgi:hypothetical protein